MLLMTSWLRQNLPSVTLKNVTMKSRLLLPNMRLLPPQLLLQQHPWPLPLWLLPLQHLLLAA